VSEETFGDPYAGWLVPFLLLSLRERGSDGPELRQRMADLGFGATHPRAMYRALRRMEREGLISSESHGLDGPVRPRRRFSITGSGEAYLELWADALARYREEVDLFFSTYAGKLVRTAQTREGLNRVPPGPTRSATGARSRPRPRSLRCVKDR
jgi:poly-beta-hydroxybutyrate-responsive repressor